MKFVFDSQYCINLGMETNAYSPTTLAGGHRLVRCSRSLQESGRTQLLCKKITLRSILFEMEFMFSRRI